MKLKIFEDGYSKSKRMLLAIDYLQNEIFKNRLTFLKGEQDSLFKSLLDAPVMHVDGTVAKVNGTNHNVVVCSSGRATMYFAWESKGHAGRDTPVKTFGGILFHDHEACFYGYGSDHQEC